MIEDKNTQKTDLENIGEFGLIDQLTKNFKINHKSTIKGIGDDAAVLSPNKKMVISTDLLIENVHFDLAYCPLKHLGYKSVIVNLSDIYAMNAEAKQITVSIGASNRFPLEALEEVYEGIRTACKIYNIDLIGGDTTSSDKGLIISITAIGEANEEDIVYRNGANKNDLLVVTGDIAGAYMGLQILERENEVYKVNPNNQPDLDFYSYIIERQLKPEARKDIIELLKKLEVKPTSMIDISDGLSSEVLHLAKQSNVGIELYEDKLPLDPQVISTCEEFKFNSTTAALNGGEDYELLMTFKQEDYDKIKGNPNLTVIGFVTEKERGCNLITRGNSSTPIIAKGWKSF